MSLRAMSPSQDVYVPVMSDTCEQEWQKYIKHFMNGGWDPRHVVTAITHATTGTQPRPLYVIGLDAKVNFSLVDLLPVRVKEAIVIQHGFKNMVPAATKTH